MEEGLRPTDILTEMPIRPFVTTGPGLTGTQIGYLPAPLITTHRQEIMGRTTIKQRRNRLPGQECVPVADFQ